MISMVQEDSKQHIPKIKFKIFQKKKKMKIYAIQLLIYEIVNL